MPQHENECGEDPSVSRYSILLLSISIFILYKKEHTKNKQIADVYELIDCHWFWRLAIRKSLNSFSTVNEQTNTSCWVWLEVKGCHIQPDMRIFKFVLIGNFSTCASHELWIVSNAVQALSSFFESFCQATADELEGREIKDDCDKIQLRCRRSSEQKR